MNEEQAILERDQQAAFEYNQRKIQQHGEARAILQKNNDQMINENMRRKDLEKLESQQVVGLSPGHVGWGYHN